MRGFIKKPLILIIICSWKLNSLIGADFYTYAHIHITPETLKMECLSSVIWGPIWILTFVEPLKLVVYIFTLYRSIPLSPGIFLS